MSATKFKISVERVEKEVFSAVIAADSAMEAYDSMQKDAKKLYNLLCSESVSKQVIHHIIKVEEEKEETNE